MKSKVNKLTTSFQYFSYYMLSHMRLSWPLLNAALDLFCFTPKILIWVDPGYLRHVLICWELKVVPGCCRKEINIWSCALRFGYKHSRMWNLYFKLSCSEEQLVLTLTCFGRITLSLPLPF